MCVYIYVNIRIRILFSILCIMTSHIKKLCIIMYYTYVYYIYILFSTSDLYIPYNCSSLEHINKKILFKCAAQLTFLCILYVDIFVSKSAKMQW